MKLPVDRSGLGVDLGSGIALGALGAVLVVRLPLFVAVALVLGLLGVAVLTRFGSGGGSGTGAGGPVELAGALLVATAFTMPMNRLRPPGMSLPVSDMLLVLTVGAFILVRLAEHRPATERTYTPIFACLGILGAGGLIGAVFEVPGPFMYKALGVPIRDVSGWAQNLGNLGTFLVGSLIPMLCWWLARPGRLLLRRVMWAFVIGCTVSAFVALALPYGRGGSRMVGITVHPNQLGSLSLIGMGLAIGLILSHRPDRLLPYVVFPILAGAVIGSGSRAALGGVILLGLIIGPLTGSRSLMMALLAGVAVVLLVFATGIVEPEGENAIGRAFGDSETAEGSDSIRDTLETEVWKRFEARPLTGNGFNYMRPSHNVYLGLIACTGVLGVLGLGGIISTIVRRTWRRRTDLLTVAATAAYVAYLGNAFFDNIFWWRWLWFFVGMVIATTATRPTRGEVGYEPAPELARSTR